MSIHVLVPSLTLIMYKSRASTFASAGGAAGLGPELSAILGDLSQVYFLRRRALDPDSQRLRRQEKAPSPPQASRKVRAKKHAEPPAAL